MPAEDSPTPSPDEIVTVEFLVVVRANSRAWAAIAGIESTRDAVGGSITKVAAQRGRARQRSWVSSNVVQLWPTTSPASRASGPAV